MDRPGADVWATTFRQLMTETKPQDTWVLLPEGKLVAGRLDHGCSQYRLKGLARLQCGRCLGAWGSAHVQILFHLCWDEDSRQGLVKMRMWGQQCRLCPRGASSECQVSSPSVRPFLNKLALHVLRKCYGESPGPDQCPRFHYKTPGNVPRPCEACDLGTCFLQKGLGPAPSPRAIRGSYTTYSGVGLTITTSSVPGRTRLLALGSKPVVRWPRGSKPYTMRKGCFAIPLSVSDFIKNPLTDSSHFFSKGEGVITIPFSLENKDKGPVANGSSHGPTKEGSLPAADTIGKGSLCLSANSMAIPEGKGIPVNIKDPIFHGKGLLISNIELKGFIFKGKGSISDPIDIARVQGLVYDGNDTTIAGKGPVLVSYIIGLMANGEGSITFPLSFTNIIKGKDSFTNITEGNSSQEACNNGPATSGHNALLGTISDDGAITFPFIFTDGIKGPDSRINLTKGQGKENGSNGLATTDDDPLPETKTGSLITSNKGAFTSSTGDTKGKESTDITKNKGEDNDGHSSLSTGPEFSSNDPIAKEKAAVTSSTDNASDKDSFTVTTEAKERVDGDNVTAAAGHHPRLKASSAASITFSEGSITIPFSVFNIIKHKGPQSTGFLPHGYSKKKKRLRSRFSKSSCGSRRDEDFCSANPCQGAHAEPYEDVWIWVSMTVCVLWLMCMYKLSPSIFQ